MLGPRQTGKSTLSLSALPEAEYINLAESDTFRELSARPELIRQRLREDVKFLIIDEAQRLPAAFDEAQVLLDRNKQLRVIFNLIFQIVKIVDKLK